MLIGSLHPRRHDDPFGPTLRRGHRHAAGHRHPCPAAASPPALDKIEPALLDLIDRWTLGETDEVARRLTARGVRPRAMAPEPLIPVILEPWVGLDSSSIDADGCACSSSGSDVTGSGVVAVVSCLLWLLRRRLTHEWLSAAR